MSIDMYVSSSQEQATSVNTMCQKQIQGYQQLQQAINQFVNEQCRTPRENL